MPVCSTLEISPGDADYLKIPLSVKTTRTPDRASCPWVIGKANTQHQIRMPLVFAESNAAVCRRSTRPASGMIACLPLPMEELHHNPAPAVLS